MAVFPRSHRKAICRSACVAGTCVSPSAGGAWAHPRLASGGSLPPPRLVVVATRLVSVSFPVSANAQYVFFKIFFVFVLMLTQNVRCFCASSCIQLAFHGRADNRNVLPGLSKQKSPRAQVLEREVAEGRAGPGCPCKRQPCAVRMACLGFTRLGVRGGCPRGCFRDCI